MTANVLCLEYWHASLLRTLPAVHRLRVIDVACAFGVIYAVRKVLQVARHKLKTTALRGPPNPSFLFGLHNVLFDAPNAGEIYEKWAEEYGGVYEIPMPLGQRNIVLCDPKAIGHVWGGEPWTYTLTSSGRIVTESVVGKGNILSAQGENHRRQRKTLTPAFSNAAIRDLTHVFFDSVYKAKGIWDTIIDETGESSAVIDVQNWMNHISLDTIGRAGFSHDFGSLDGNPALVTDVFDAFGDSSGSKTVDMFITMLVMASPWLLDIPTTRSKLLKRMHDAIDEISNELLTTRRKEKEVGALGENEERSMLGLLVKAEDQDDQLLTSKELSSQAWAKALLIAGYESTSVSLTWALIEISRNPGIQSKLRAELLEFGADPTYDQLSTHLPYLDAVVHEILRTHAPLPEFTRMAAVDDAIPLSRPIRTKSGQLVDHISVAKGTHLFISVPAVNCSTALWGPDAKQFKPERWIDADGIPAAAREIQGHRHLLSFIDGPRICLGRGFAITELKIVLSVLVKHFVFELRDGPETVMGVAKGILSRPKVAGEEGAAFPLRVRRFE